MASTAGPSVVPMLPSFDNTLGALYIGSTLSTLLYGVICVQTFLYLTSRHAKVDSWKLTGMVLLILALDTVHQGMILAGMYKFLISDFVNPAALPVGGPSSGEKLISLDEGFVAVSTILMIQLFFCHRLWVISAVAFRMPIRVALVALAISLALLNCGAWSALAVLGYHHRLMMVNPPNYILSWKISTASGIAFDSIITVALSSSLWRSRSGMKRSDHVIRLLIVATVNTGLITTLLSIAELTTVLALPNATVYGGIAFILPKSYINSFLATLNSREFLRDKLQHETQVPPISIQTVQFQRGDVYSSNPETTTELGSSKEETIELSLRPTAGKESSGSEFV
ncbi:hypothetical protein C8R45DRAFT_993945 [Mycena sanguinolenta]|nr:hypothetical protein C8R45DRAFT_993945 [Mycena sanguinolenta]